MREDQPGFLRTIWSALRSPLPPGYGGTPTFGWLLVVLFAVQLLTGVLLGMYYRAAPELVQGSLRHLMRDVSWGWLVRGIHRWAADGMVVLCLLQLVRFLVNGRYRGGRAGHWVLGLTMGGVILALAFGGGLLVWDQNAYWLLVSAAQGLEALPCIGPGLASVVRGGDEVTATTLSRAFAAHALLLPCLFALLLVLNLWVLGRRYRAGGRS